MSLEFVCICLRFPTANNVLYKIDVSDVPYFTIRELQQLLTGQSVRVVNSGGQSQIVDSDQLNNMFSPETQITPNGHNGSYTIYSENGYTVLTPISRQHKLSWSSV